MPFDAVRKKSPKGRQRIAVIGTGVSGLSAAWLLADAHDVVVYERDDRLGGHTNTVDADLPSGGLPVDTGFIVFNEPSYPNFTAMLDHLDVATEASCMSFGASIDRGRVEYSGQTLSSVFAKRSNAASPTFWKMLRDIPRFHRDARSALRSGFCEHASLGEFVTQRKYGRGFCDHFLKPMAAAIWSTPSVKVFDYPALSFFKFFENHGLLQVLNLPIWHTVSGGARSYVRELEKSFADNVRLSSAVTNIVRTADGVVVTDISGAVDRFDQVVIASHADAASAMLGDADERERAILSAFQYQPNRAVLHLDAAQMPRRRRAWSSWNYISEGGDGAVSYWMNRLQNLQCQEDIFVTLNPVGDIPEEKVLGDFTYDHPMFNAATSRAQRDIGAIQGRGGVWYAGAHLGYGFHEDGLQSGLAVAEAIGGVQRPWRVENESGRLQQTEILEARV
ncbi:MAG: FAD-dependent oxidoreductase [Pseudomonadota bacterium]